MRDCVPDLREPKGQPMASVRANVRPEILTWARKTAGLEPDEAAQKLQVKPERLAQWETGDLKPTINQLRKMARVYKRPLSVFYLQEEPQGFQVIHDYRRLPDEGIRSFSPDLTLEMRTANERRELMLSLYEEVDEEPGTFTFTATLDDDPEVVGSRIREFLGVRYELQTQWSNHRLAFNAWRNHLESAGVLVLQMAKVSAAAVNGFAIAYDQLPVIAVNRKDAFPRRIFSLLHEFVHLALRASGVSDLDVDATRPPQDQRVEVFCNAAAAAALMPRDLFLEEPVVYEKPSQRREWDEAEIEELASRYSVSREAVVRRLLTLERTTESFYRQKREQYAQEYLQRQAREREKLQNQEFRRNPARDAISVNGTLFARLVLDTYHRDRITLSDVSSFLGVRVRHLAKIERDLGMR